MVPSNAYVKYIRFFMGMLFVPMFIAGIVMMIKSPELLKKRLNAKENENEQKQVLLFSGLMFLAGFILAGLNYRYSWIVLSKSVSIIASVLFVIAYIKLYHFSVLLY